MFQFGEKWYRRSKNEGEISENAGDPPQKKIVKRSYLLLNLELGALLWAVGSPYIYLQTIFATFGPKTIFQHKYFSEVKQTVRLQLYQGITYSHAPIKGVPLGFY